MKSDIGHLLIHINPQNIPFYRDLFTFLGWTICLAEPDMLGVANERGGSLWFGAPIKDLPNDYDGIGMNHLAIAVTTQADVDAVVAFLKEHKITPLFETPRHRPDFCSSPDETYYQVMFASPDRILLEVVYTGARTK